MSGKYAPVCTQLVKGEKCRERSVCGGMEGDVIQYACLSCWRNRTGKFALSIDIREGKRCRGCNRSACADVLGRTHLDYMCAKCMSEIAFSRHIPRVVPPLTRQCYQCKYIFETDYIGYQPLCRECRNNIRAIKGKYVVSSKERGRDERHYEHETTKRPRDDTGFYLDNTHDTSKRIDNGDTKNGVNNGVDNIKTIVAAPVAAPVTTDSGAGSLQTDIPANLKFKNPESMAVFSICMKMISDLEASSNRLG